MQCNNIQLKPGFGNFGNLAMRMELRSKLLAAKLGLAKLGLAKLSLAKHGQLVVLCCTSHLVESLDPLGA